MGQGFLNAMGEATRAFFNFQEHEVSLASFMPTTMYGKGVMLILCLALMTFIYACTVVIRFFMARVIEKRGWTYYFALPDSRDEVNLLDEIEVEVLQENLRTIQQK